MKSRILLLLALAAAGFAAGSAIGHFRGPVDELDRERTKSGRVADVLARAGNAVSAGGSIPSVVPFARPSRDALMAASMDERLALLVRWLPDADAAEVAALAAEWLGDERGSGSVEWQVLAVRWVEVDPVAAVAFARARTESYLRGPDRPFAGVTPLHPVYRALGRLDPDLALAFLSEESPRRLRHFVHDIVDWVGVEKAQAWVDSLPDGEEMESLRVVIRMRNSAGREPDSEPPPLTAEEKIKRTAEEWGKWPQMIPDDRLAAKVTELTVSDPAQARAVLDSMPAHLGRARLEAVHVAALARTDVQAALQAAEKLSGIARLQAMAGIAAERAKTDPAGALKLLREHGVGDFSAAGLYTSQVDGPVGASMWFSGGTDVLAETLKAVAAHDPAGTLQLLAETDSLHLYKNRDPSQKPLAVQIFNQWAGQDPAAAAQWVGQQPMGTSTPNFVQGAAGEWFAKDAAALQQFAAALPAGWIKEFFARETAALMAPGDPAGALAWVAQTGGEMALGTVFRTMATNTPEIAAAHFATLPAAQQEQQLQHLADTLGRRAPVAAVEFFHSLPAERQAAVGLRETAMAYVKHDAQAASTWVASLPPTEARDTAIGGLVDYLVKVSSDPDPEAAAHWAAASLDPEGRDRRLQVVAEAWFRRDADGARAAIDEAALPVEVKNALLRHEPPAR